MSETDTPAPQTAEPTDVDTSAPVDQAEASTQTNEAPEATQDVKEPELNATDTVEEKLFAGKYKTVEEMESAYKSLESKYGQTTSEKAELAKILNEAFLTPEQVSSDTDEVSYQDESPSTNPEFKSLQRTVAIQSFLMTHDNADGAAMQKVLAEDPFISQISGDEAKLEYAYLRSQNMAQPKAVAEAEKKAASQAQAKVVEKQAARVESASKATPTDENSELMERATGNYSKEERDAARKALIRKNLVNL